jgi:hypothetical protein
VIGLFAAAAGFAGQLAAQGRVEGDVVAGALPGVDHDGVHPGGRDAHLAGLQGATRQPLGDLHDHLAAVARGQGQGLGVEVGGLVLEADVAVLVGGAGAHQGHVHGKGLVAQVFAAVEHDQLGQIIARALVHAPAALARVAHRAQAHVGEQARAAGADLAQQLAGHAAGQDVGLDLVVQRQLLHGRRPDPVAADHAPHQALMGKAVHALGLLVADAQGVHHAEIARRAAGQKAGLHGLEQARRLHQAATPAHQPTVSPSRISHGLGRAHEFGFARVHAGPQRCRSNRAAPFFIRLRAITVRWISLVPSKMR